MVELIKHGVYLLDGQKVVEDTTGMLFYTFISNTRDLLLQ